MVKVSRNWQHKDLAAGRWFELTICEQMANVGAEIGRAGNWRIKDKKIAQAAFYRGLELLTLTKMDRKNRGRLKELCRLYELLVDWWLGGQEYGDADYDWNKYFYSYNYAARL